MGISSVFKAQVSTALNKTASNIDFTPDLSLWEKPTEEVPVEKVDTHFEEQLPLSEVASFQEQLAEFAKLETIKRELEEALKLVKSKATSLQGPLLEELDTNGIKNISVGGLSIYKRRSRHVTKKSEADGVTVQVICDVLKKLGKGGLVADSYSPGALKTHVLEMIDMNEEIPEELGKLINVVEVDVLTSAKR